MSHFNNLYPKTKTEYFFLYLAATLSFYLTQAGGALYNLAYPLISAFGLGYQTMLLQSILFLATAYGLLYAVDEVLDKLKIG